METISCKKIGGNMASILSKIIKDCAPIVITGDNNEEVVMLTLSEYRGLQETLFLLSDPANAKHLQKAISDLNNKGVEVQLEDL